MASVFRLKVGAVEVQLEGSSLSVADAKELIGFVHDLYGNQPSEEAPAAKIKQSSTPAAPLNKLHVNSVAKKLGAKSGPDLALAAAASLQVFQGMDDFSRADLLNEMKKATQYYKTSMTKNLSSIISSLLGDSFNQIGDVKYSLTAGALYKLTANLA